MDEGGKQQGKFVKTKENKRSSKELREGMQSREGAWVKAFIENWKKNKNMKTQNQKAWGGLTALGDQTKQLVCAENQEHYHPCLIKVWI